ncbi:glycosyltransferase family 2 protein [Rhodococcus sp. ARC_M12]|uniref:glycosyltransferase family A protein n=1 Tax=Rhodococcus sp. ARC_M12 TaxID=2928854 RepID=UPI001FB49973|nr:glycosyltransferase family A protein [Rhodococcus sp. ARC_M12]MCJ0977926.1 glycosyltransferase family 2 protein [Rhodococcus sp. ARC_M12]
MPDSSTRFPRRVPASVTVIVPVRNGAHTIGAQLDALQEQSYAGRFDILVSDNGSSDDLAGLLARRQGQGRVPVGYVLADELPGASHARNVGARHATENSSPTATRAMLCENTGCTTWLWPQGMQTS